LIHSACFAEPVGVLAWSYHAELVLLDYGGFVKFCEVEMA
jgi:hypothetical protein